MKRIWLIAAAAGLCACRGGRVQVHIPTDTSRPVGSSPTAGGVMIVDPLPPPVDRKPAHTEASLAPVETLPRTLEDAVHTVNAQLQDIYFAYDRFALTPETLDALRRNAGLLRDILAEFPPVRIVVEGHCDERGSAEYNLALGDRRAASAADALAEFGLPLSRIRTVSYGKEVPQCSESAESCWRLNRRAHFAVSSAPGTE